MKTFYNLKPLIQEVRAAAAGVDAITFDIFDTLLVRRIHDPDMVKPAVSAFIAAMAARDGIAIEASAVFALRNLLECGHRAKNGAIFPDCEARYPEYMGETLRRIWKERYTEALLRDVTEWELRLETAMIAPRAGLLDLLRELRSAGKTIWLLSDIYLPSDHLARLADHAGLAPFIDGIHSSADHCEAKASGAAFDRLIREKHWDVSRWLHIGDNPVSDGLRPAERGIRAFVISDASEKFRKGAARRYCAAARVRPFWKGRFVQQLMMPLEAENAPRDPLYVHGYNLFGPMIAAFVHHVAERTRALGIRRVYFFSREGWTFLRAWQSMTPYLFPLGDAPEASYLHVSRMALAGATCAQRGLVHANAPIALLPAGNRDLRDVGRVFGLDMEKLRPHLARHSLAPDTTLNPVYKGWTAEHWHNFDCLLHDRDFQAAVKEQAGEYGRLVERYLEQEGFFKHGQVAVVDIGWLGTIQRFLHDAVAHRPDKPALRGFVLSATRGIPFPTSPDNSIEGFLYDKEQFDFASSLVTYSLDVFEEACRAPHGQVCGYRERGGRVEPVFAKDSNPNRRREMEQDAYYEPLRRGVLDAAPRYAAAMTVAGYSPAELHPWFRHLIAMRLAFPKSREVRVLKWKHHYDDFYGANRPPLKTRLFLLRLWDINDFILRWIPGVCLGYFMVYAGGRPFFARMAARLKKALVKAGILR